MSRLFLVRHAQASFLADDYDQLSELGYRQARALGDHWARLDQSFDRVFVGPRRRHRQTLEGIVAGFEALGVGLPKETELAELDEYAADLIVVAWLPRVVAEQPELAALSREAQDAVDLAARGRALDKLLQQALRAWASDSSSAAPGCESWLEFAARIRAAFAELTAGEGSGRRILAVSSAGTIGALVGQVVKTTPEVMVELGWGIHNAAVSEIVFSGGRANLASFNVLAHLQEPSSWTRR